MARVLCSIAALLGIALLLASSAHASPCIEALSKPGSVLTYYAASGKYINDPGVYEDCRVLFPNTTWCNFIVALNETEPGAIVPGTPFTFGLSICAPAVCADDIENGFESILPFLAQHVPVLTNETSATCGEWTKPPPLTKGAKTMIAVTAILGILTVLGSLLGFFERRLSLLRKAPYIEPEEELAYTPGESDEDPLVGAKRNDKPFTVQGPVAGFFRCFDIFHNLPRLAASDNSSLAYLNGIRVMSMCWVITGHSILWIIGLISNTAEIPTIVSQLYMQLIFNAPFSVDSFFFLSGLLVAYLSYGAMKKGAFSWVLYYVHRYVRLTPVYLFWILFAWKLLPFIAAGPYYQLRVSLPLGDCSSGWWKDILYINNLFGFNEACYPVAWYLGNDMQFYVFAPFLVYAFYRWRRLGAGLLMAALVATILANWIVAGVNHLTALTKDPNKQNLINNELYIKPWMRAGAYLVGMGTGLVIAAFPRVRFPVYVRYGLYLAAGAVGVTLLLSPHPNYLLVPKVWPDAAWAAYYGLSRPVWTLCLAAFVIPFAYGYGDFVRRFLGAAFWTPLARLTFGAYLIHPVFLSYYVATQTEQFRYTFRNWMQLSIFAILMSYGLAFISYLILEKPLMNLEAWVTRLIRGSPSAHEDRHRSVNTDRRE